MVGLKERGGKVVALHTKKADKATLQPFVEKVQGSTVYKDEHGAYAGLHRNHETVKHSAHFNDNALGIESFWALIKRASTHHWWTFKHLHRYVNVYR